MVTLAFHGAAKTVTGSKHLLTCGEERLLVDCGQFQGIKELRLKNWDPPAFDAKAVNWAALTHTHIDHCGWLPRLVKSGFSGPVYCTPATADLLPIILLDAAKLQEEDAAYFNKHGGSKHDPALPLFGEEDVRETLKLLQPVDYGALKAVGKAFTLRFIDVGHILGSAMIETTVRDAGRTVKVLFSGDVGRYDTPLPPDPEPPPQCDYYLIESTYGDRLHPAEDPETQVETVVKLILPESGILLIPAFAVGRSQQLLFILRELMNAGRIPKVPVYLDSPMAFETTGVYLKYLANHKVKMDAIKGGGGITGDNVKLVKTQQDSQRLAELKGPAVVIASSGMLAGGRVLHHMKNFMPRPSSVLALAGYQAEGTRGRMLLEGKREIKVMGEPVEIKGRVVDMGGFSGHADAGELMRWLSAVKAPPKRAFIVHGEAKASAVFAERLARERGWPVKVPDLHSEETL